MTQKHNKIIIKYPVIREFDCWVKISCLCVPIDGMYYLNANVRCWIATLLMEGKKMLIVIKL